MKIATGWDHRGRRFRPMLEKLLAKLGHELVDLGATSDVSSDYPDFAFRVGEAVSRGEADRGLLVCGTGIGMCIAANKVKGVRAGLAYDEGTAKYSRAHNDANVLCVGEQTADGPMLEKILSIWLTTPFEGDRHSRRVDKIMEYERRHGGQGA